MAKKDLSSDDGEQPVGKQRPTVRNSPLRILVAWQPGTGGNEAIDTAAWLTRALPARVRAVSTILRLWPSTSLSKLGSGYEKWLGKETKLYAKEVKKAFAEAGIDQDQWDEDFAVVLDGTSESTLLAEAATKFGADLLIVGSHAAAPKGRFLTGTTSDALLHSSPIPLGLAPRAVKLSRRGITRVNVAYLDPLAEDDHHVLHFGGELAELLGVPLRLVAFSPTGLTAGALDDRIDLTSELRDEWREHALGMLDRARDLIMDERPNLNVDTAFGSGSGWSGAVDALKWKKGDLLTIGSTTLGPIERVFVSSTTAQFMQHVTVPVIIRPVAAPPDH